MGDLFIELYLDEDVDVLVAELIRARGFEAITTRDAGQLQKNDEDNWHTLLASKKPLLVTIGLILRELLRSIFHQEERITVLF
jgi:hypothetical protein